MNKTIIKNIYEDIKEVSSRSLQEDSWLGKNPSKCSSYTEVMCRLFDDNNFEDFIKSSVYEIGFSTEIISELKELFVKLDNSSELDSDAEIINDPKWEGIRKIAQGVILLWNKEKPNL